MPPPEELRIYGFSALRRLGSIAFAKDSASLLDVAANDAVRLSNTTATSVDSFPVNTRNDSEAIPSNIENA